MKSIDLNSAINSSLFLLGAGASYGTQENRTGCKTSSEMFEALQNLVNDSGAEILNDIEAEALRFLLSTLQFQSNWRTLKKNSKFLFSPNIEELALVIRRVKNRENYLPYPLTGNWADKLIQLEARYEKGNNRELSLFESLEFILKNKLLPSWLEINEGSLSYLQPLVNLMSSPNLKGPICSFSLNYDLTIEKFLKSHKSKPYCGFVSEEWNGTNEKDVEGFDRLNLFKLHGSLNWVRLRESESFKERENLEEEEKKDLQNDPTHDPYVIFGHGTKTFSFEPFFSMITRFKKELASRSYIFAIGYSFFDPYINNLIIEALNKDHYKKLIIVNPTFGPKKDDGAVTSVELAEYIEEIQKDSFYSEQPEFNIQKINGSEKIIYLKVGFDNFLNEYFNNDGKKLIALIQDYEEEKNREENPF